MQSASADLPIDGRAARMTRLPGWNPEVSRSRSRKPDGMPVTSAPASYSFVIRSKLSVRSGPMCAKSPVRRCWARSNTICSARSTSSGGLTEALPAEPRDLLPRLDEPAEGGVSLTIRA